MKGTGVNSWFAIYMGRYGNKCGCKCVCIYRLANAYMYFLALPLRGPGSRDTPLDTPLAISMLSTHLGF